MGKFREFNPETEDIRAYFLCLEQFFEAEHIGIPNRRSKLLSSIGAQTFRALVDLCSPFEPQTETYAALKQRLLDHYEPARNTYEEQLAFSSRRQKPGEKFADFELALCHLAATCEFGTFLDSALRTQFYNGIASSVVREKIKDVDGNMTAMVRRAQLYETLSTHDNGGSAMLAGGAVNKVTANRRPMWNKPAPTTSSKVICAGCSANHQRTQCPFRNATCMTCQRVGHIARACRSGNSNKKKPAANFSKIASGGRVQTVTSSEPDTSTQETQFDLCAISSDKDDRVFVTIGVNDVSLRMEVDTGAIASLIGENEFQRNFPNQQLSQAKVYRSCTGHRVDLVGEFRVCVTLDGWRVENLVLRVVREPFPNLLGRSWIHQLPLDWAKLFPPPTSRILKVDLQPKNVGEALRLQFPTVFAETPGVIKGFEAHVVLKEGARPTFYGPRVVPVPLREATKQALQSMERNGFIRRCTTRTWGTPIVIVPNTDGSVRVCGDFSVTVNPQLNSEHYPLPRIDDLSLIKGKSFCILDLAQAYQQLAVGPESREVRTLSTPEGCFQCLRLPYGLASAPAIFQSAMSQILAGLDCFVYLDDVLVAGDSDNDCRRKVEDVLKRFQEFNVAVNFSKCRFLEPQVTYLGHLLDAEGLHPDPGKVAALRNAPEPTTPAEVHSFIGFVTFFHKFVPNMSTMLQPLYPLVKKDCVWTWGPDQRAAYRKCVDVVSGDRVLTPYSLQRPLRLTCDASQTGCGSVLSHVLPDGTEQPIAFTSKTFSSAERAYAQHEREAAGIIFGVRKFHKYLFGRPFELVTDNAPLATIFGPKAHLRQMTSLRLQRWAVLLSAYVYTIKLKKSAQIPQADFLSRKPVNDTTEVESPIFAVSLIPGGPLTAAEVSEETSKDPVLRQILAYVLHGWPDNVQEDQILQFSKRKLELSVDNGCVLWGTRVVVPASLRSRVMELLHELHPGSSRMKGLARGYVWWPGLDQDLEDLVKCCSVCQMVHHQPPAEQSIPWTWPTRKWQRIFIDFAVFEGTTLLVIIDGHSKWPEVCIMKKGTTAAEVCEKLRHLFSTWGLPEELVSDNGPPFRLAEFEEFLESNHVLHTCSPIYNPRSNGQAENAVKITKMGLLKQLLDQKSSSRSLQHKIDAFLFVYRNTPHTLTGVSPAELFLGRRPRTPLSCLLPQLKHKIHQRHAKVAHDRRLTKYRPGDLVWVRSFTHRRVKWVAGIVAAEVSTVSYDVDVEGKIKHVSSSHLRPRHPGALTFEENPGPVSELALEDNTRPLVQPNGQSPVFPRRERERPSPEAPTTSESSGEPSEGPAPEPEPLANQETREIEPPPPSRAGSTSPGPERVRPRRNSTFPRKFKDFVCN